MQQTVRETKTHSIISNRSAHTRTKTAMICIFLVLPLACALYENAHKKASSEPQDPLKQQLLDEIFEREMV